MGGKAKSKKCVFRCFLKIATEMAERTDSRRLFQGDEAQEWKALAPVLVFTLGTDRLILLFDLSEWDGSDVARHGVKINRLYFTQGFVGQQTDPERYFKPYCQPMKDTKTVEHCDWMEVDFVTKQASQFWIRWRLVTSASVIPYKSELQSRVRVEHIKILVSPKTDW